LVPVIVSPHKRCRLHTTLHSSPTRRSSDLDRIDNNKGYESGNVHWVTPSDNLINRRKKEHWGITYDGRSYYAKITRMYTERRSRALKTLEEALHLRDLYVREYEEDKEKWIEDTVTNNFQRTV